MLPVRRRFIPALACVVLLSWGGLALAETRQLGADGGSAPDTTAGGERLDEAEGEGAGAAGQRRTQKAKQPAAASPRGSTRPAAPRWHSFLPGMFR